MIRLGASAAQDEDPTEVWIITYCDMVTLLLAFFLLMYSFNLAGEDKQRQLAEAVRSGGVVARTSDVQLEQVARDIATRLQAGGEKGVWVDASESEVTIGLPAGITFDSGRADLTPDARAQIAAVAPTLARLSTSIRVEGHTDDVPTRGGEFPTNWHLSVARAQAVVRLLLAAGVAPDRLQVVGYADGHPRASNDTEAGRAANRRIEIRLIRSGR